LLESPTSRKVFRRIRDDSSSLYVQRDSLSLYSRWTGTVSTLSKISKVFEFDRELFISKVYEKALRDALKEKLGRQRLEGGILPTVEETAKSKDINKDLAKDRRRLRREAKVLMLGDPTFNEIIIKLLDAHNNDTTNTTDIGRTATLYETRVSSHSIILNVCLILDQRSDPKKWLPSFENALSVIVSIDLSCYDEIEDNTSANKMVQALYYFDLMVNSRWLAHASIIMYFWSVTTFRAKLNVTPLSNYFSEYTGGNDANHAAEYIFRRFTQLNRARLQLFSYFIEEADNSTVRLLWDAVNSTIVHNNQKSMGL
jgi:hypothetical protein